MTVSQVEDAMAECFGIPTAKDSSESHACRKSMSYHMIQHLIEHSKHIECARESERESALARLYDIQPESVCGHTWKHCCTRHLLLAIAPVEVARIASECVAHCCKLNTFRVRSKFLFEAVAAVHGMFPKHSSFDFR